MKQIRLWLMVGFCLCLLPMKAQDAIHDLLNRIGGQGTADRFVVAVDPSLTSNGQETFVISGQNDKPCIKGSTTLAVTTGINWYLNHYAHVNLTWNNLTTDLTSCNLPVPAQPETRTCNADYRYYLNYCTFSYSMSTWTWKRWEQEIDWMALHGINMPLQIVGLDVVWQKLLIEDLGYTLQEANDFIAGPCFQAWWGMNNLEGWGGPNRSWWYTRQENLAKNILKRQRELGMQPVLPGYSGMVPSNITQKKGYAANNQGKWCNFLRPYILDPNSSAFAEISRLYYKRLNEVMGTSKYYSMDPFHEGANTTGIDVRQAYAKIAEAMTKANKDGKWVIQYWQWNSAQYNVLDMVPKGKLIVLDLFSDAHTHFGDYRGHDAVYCALPNFGGRTGLFGRLTKIMSHYYQQKSQFKNIKGIGATPEAIEQTPVIYDALFELPWRNVAPNAQEWLKEYTVGRYGKANTQAQEAWEKVRNTALNCETGLQGPHEAVLCARPALQVNSVSSWGGAGIFYDAQELADAAYKLLQAQHELNGNNYSYDLTDFSRQALTDYGNYLLKAIKQAYDSHDQKSYQQRRDTYLQLILDLDELLNTNENFMLGRWTQMARGIADEVSGTSNVDKNWLELNNARTLITTWGAKDQSEWGGLRDYSYREWGGMMKDFYYKRWKTFFERLDKNQGQPDWFQNDWNWAHNKSFSYSNTPIGNTAKVAEKLFNKYFMNFKVNEGQVYHAYRCLETDARATIQKETLRGGTYTFPVSGLNETEVTIGIDFNNDNNISKEETQQGLTMDIPADAVAGNVLAQVSLNDGTIFKFKLILKDEIKTPRTVSVITSDKKFGSASIQGSKETSVTNQEAVTIIAIPKAGYNFTNWTNEKGILVSTENPYTYLGAADATFTAHFNKDKWGNPQEDLKEWKTIEDYGQYLTFIKIGQNNREEQNVYTASSCPKNLFQTTQLFNAAKGSQFSIHWKDQGGMNYCRLSAYIDLNADGDFEDEGEFLTVLGNKSNAGNNMLNEHTLKVLLPYEIPEGITHVRLRFDGAWQLDNLNKHDAVPAKAKTLRMVYDIPVNVTIQASTASTITVKSENTQKGTVDANGQPETYTYGVGEEVVLRCYPVNGYYLKNWTDQYGRVVPESWMNGNNIRFHAPESGTYTAHFTKNQPSAGSVVTIGDWKAESEEFCNGIRLKHVIQVGTSKLDLTQTENPVLGVAPDFFKNQATLKEITLPATLLELDNVISDHTIQGVAAPGNGDAGKDVITIKPNSTIKGNQAWTMVMDVQNNDATFNPWGSSLIATGNNPFLDSYKNGFQLYLQAGNNLIFKQGNANDNNAFTNVEGDFSLMIRYDGKEMIQATLFRADGTSETKEFKERLNDISELSCGLPQGINLSRIAFFDEDLKGNPFEGCNELCKINVENGSTFFSDKNGILFNSSGNKLIAYPSGRIYAQAYTLKNKATGQYITSTPPADKSGKIIATDGNGPERYALTSTDASAASLWKFTKIQVNGSEKNELYHFNSKGFLGGKSGQGGEGQILEVLSNPEWAGSYEISWVNDFDNSLTATIALQQKGENLKLSSKDGHVKFVSGNNTNDEVKWELTEVSSTSIDISDKGWASVAFPVTSITPANEGAVVYKAEKFDDGILMLTSIVPGSPIAAGEGLLVKASPNTSVTFKLSAMDEAEALTGNLLKGSLANRVGYTPKDFYILGFDKKGLNAGMNLSSDSKTPLNSAFLLASDSPKTSYLGLGNTDYNIAIDEYDYVSLYLNYSVEIPEGVKAYTVSGVKNNELTLTEISTKNRTLSKGTPVILYADIAAGDKQVFSFKYNSQDSNETIQENFLKGTSTDQFVCPASGHTAYVMTIHEGMLKMMQAKLNLNESGENGTTHFKNQARKAYLELPDELSQNIQVFSFNREGNTTGISENRMNSQQLIYDLQGRRIQKILSPGFYIINGKKQIIK